MHQDPQWITLFWIESWGILRLLNLFVTQLSLCFCRKPCMWGTRTRTTESTPSPAQHLSLQVHILQSHLPALSVRGAGSHPPWKGRNTTHCCCSVPNYFLLIYFPVTFSFFWAFPLVRLISQEPGTQPHVAWSNMLPIRLWLMLHNGNYLNEFWAV